MSTMGFLERNPIDRMNRQQRRRAMREQGVSWQKARQAARRRDRDRSGEGAVAQAAAKLTPAEARRALAEWAARGGDGIALSLNNRTFEISEVGDLTKW